MRTLADAGGEGEHRAVFGVVLSGVAEVLENLSNPSKNRSRPRSRPW